MILWIATFAAAISLYVFTATPAWVLMSKSDNILATAAQWFYSPLVSLRSHAEWLDVFFQEQWSFWLPIIG